MQAADGPTGQVPGAKPSPNNMPVSWYYVQDLQQVLWATAEGNERRTRLDLLKRTWKSSIWSEEEDEEMTLTDPEVPVVYSLHYTQQGRQDWEDELPPETMGRMKKQVKGKSNLHAEEDFVEKLQSMNLAPVSVSSSGNIRRFLKRCPHACLARNWSRWTSNSNQNLKGLW